jgi:zinc transport system substrate-binding protein
MSVETGGKEPTARAIAALVERAKADRAPAIFVQAQFPVAAANTIAAQAGASVVPLDPLAPDWLDNVKRMGEALKKAYK